MFATPAEAAAKGKGRLEPPACPLAGDWSVFTSGEVEEESMALRRFIIERDIPKVGTFERDQLRQAAAKSNEVLRQLGPDIQWQESFVAADKTFCVYLAKDEAVIRKHAEISGFPATRINRADASSAAMCTPSPPPRMPRSPRINPLDAPSPTRAWP